MVEESVYIESILIASATATGQIGDLNGITGKLDYLKSLELTYLASSALQITK